MSRSSLLKMTSTVKIVLTCMVIVGVFASIFIITLNQGSQTGSQASTINVNRSSSQIANLTVSSPRSVSCVSATFCMAVNSTGNALEFDGKTWKHLTADPHSFLTSVSCVSIKFCLAVDGQADYTLFNGLTFSTPVPASPGLKQSLNSVSCATSKFCIAVDNNGDELTFNGSSWAPLKSIESASQSTSNYLVQVSCGSASFCVAIDDAGNAIIYSDGKWNKPIIADSVYPTGISCFSASACYIIDGGGSIVEESSGTLSSPVQIDPLGHLNSLSCDESGQCMASDQSNNIFIGQGTSSSGWTKIVVNGLNINAVSCLPKSTSLKCMIVGNGGSYYYNGSSLSNFIPMDSIINSFTSVSCTSITFCMAVGHSGMYSVYNGTNIVNEGYVNQNEQGVYLTSVSCSSSTFCMAVDQNGNAIEYSGNSWQDPKTVDPNKFLTSISCVTSTFCWATDGSGYAISYLGLKKGFGQLESIDKNGGLTSISCVSQSFCVAVDQTGHEVQYNGSRWSSPTQFTNASGFNYVSCFGTLQCEIANQSGNLWKLNFSTPNLSIVSLPQVNNGSGTVRGISCSASGNCEFAGSFKSSVTYPSLAIGISCTSSSFCLEVTESGSAQIYNGTLFESPLPGSAS